MSAAFAVSLFPYYNNVFFFCRLSARFVFSSFCLFPIFFCFVSDSGVFLPALLAVLFFLFQKIFSFSFPAFCRTSFRSSCLHHPSALNRPVREPVSAPRRFSCQSFVQTLFSIAFALFSVFNFPCPVFSSLLRNCRLFLSPLPLFSFLSLFSRCPKKLSCP